MPSKGLRRELQTGKVAWPWMCWERLEVPEEGGSSSCTCVPTDHTSRDAADELPCSICNLPLLLHRLCKEEKELKTELKIET